MDDESAIAGLERLGLTSYEARVFLALQKLGAGTASEVSEVADVPRSQVYGAADKLEERGLVETRQTTPTAYRPVSLEQARTRLLDQLQRTGTETFDYLETVGGSHDEDEQTEAIWLVNGSEAIASRTVEMVEATDERVLYAVDDPDLLTDPAGEALRKVARDRQVVFASANPAVLDAARTAEYAEVHEIPHERSPDVGLGRVVIVGDDDLLFSVYSSSDVVDGVEEVAIWSEDSAVGAVLSEFLREWFDRPFE